MVLKLSSLKPTFHFESLAYCMVIILQRIRGVNFYALTFTLSSMS